MKKSAKSIARIKRHERVRKNISGTETRPRLSVYRSNKAVYVQVIDDVKGVTIASSSTRSLDGKANVESCTELGKEIAKKLKKLEIEEVVFDRGGYKYHGKVKAIADGAREEGIKI